MTERPQAVATMQEDNEFTRVVEWRFAPGAETGWHRHEMNYVVVPMGNGQLKIELEDSEMFSDLKLGISYARVAGVRHNVINNNDFEFAFVEVEFKGRPLTEG
jgi:quercetin dioxygenase-like cupin family protein